MKTERATNWYVVQTLPNAERKASEHLIRQGFEIYWPRYFKRRSHARRVETILAPLFPRYMFVAVNAATQRWRSIQSTIGVSRLVCNGDTPALIRKQIIDGIRAREGENGIIKLDESGRFAPGAKIRVVDGVFSDCQGLFEAVTDGDRVAVLLDLLGRKVRVEVNMVEAL